MLSLRAYPLSTVLNLFMAALMLVCAVVAARAQERNIEIAPPPLKIIPRAERAQLNFADGPSARTRISFDLMEKHLSRAEELTGQQRFEPASTELGSYEAIIEDSLRYLSSMDKERDKTRDLYKNLELNLRRHAPRLEFIRRTTPSEYAVYVKATIEYTRKARSIALDSFYSNTVNRESLFKDKRKRHQDLVRLLNTTQVKQL